MTSQTSDRPVSYTHLYSLLYIKIETKNENPKRPRSQLVRIIKKFYCIYPQTSRIREYWIAQHVFLQRKPVVSPYLDPREVNNLDEAWVLRRENLGRETAD